MPREILHVDMDAFYASVEILDRPELAGKPVIVGGSSKRGVVCSASYEARAFGVRSAMPTGKAAKLCPGAVFLPVRMARYQEVSEEIFEVFSRFTPLVEKLSVDEAFLDLTATRRLHGGADSAARALRRAVREETGITASAGMGTTKLVAKIASDLCKPDGLLVVRPEEEDEFLAGLPVSRMWGVGPKALERLRDLGVATFGDARALSLELLESRFGKFGRAIHEFSRGIDDREEEPLREVKSVGREETYDKDILDREEVEKRLLSLSMATARRLRRKGLLARTVNLKVKYADFQQVTRARTLAEPTDDGGRFFRAARRLLKKTLAGKKPLRLLGVSVSGLAGPGGAARQLALFEDSGEPDREKRLHAALDAIGDRYGEEMIRMAALLKSGGKGKNG